MPTTCLVVGCGSRRERDNVKFYVVPNIINSKYFPDLVELSKTRREAWIAALKRNDLTISKLVNQRICSRHFVTGKPSHLKEVDHPDWVPSQHMGHELEALVKSESATARRGPARKKRKTNHEQPTEQPNEEPSESKTQDCPNDTQKQIDDIPKNIPPNFDHGGGWPLKWVD